MEDGRCEAEIKARVAIGRKAFNNNPENGQKVEKTNNKISCMECGLIWK